MNLFDLQQQAPAAFQALFERASGCAADLNLHAGGDVLPQLCTMRRLPLVLG